MNFKLWLNEIVELQKPTSKTRKSTVIKNKGTNLAKPILQYQWKTKLGNDVKLHFDKTDENAYDVVFYVNDTHYDDETADGNRIRDPEVLNSVLYTLKKKADELAMQKLTFHAQKSEKDYKFIYNLPIETQKNLVLGLLGDLLHFLQTRTPKQVPPRQSQIELAKKFNRPMPQDKPDIQPEWQEKIKLLIKTVQDEQKIDFYDFLQSYHSMFDEFKQIGYDLKNLLRHLKKYNDIVESRSPEGWKRHKNRRAEVYDKLMQRHFSDWNVVRNGDYFTLTR